MITKNGVPLKLVKGPSREGLLDCLRLGPGVPEMSIVEFWGEQKTASSTSGGALRIQITGLHQLPSSGRGSKFFFWGNLRQITSGPKYVPPHKAKVVKHAYGEWDCYTRAGKVIFGDTPFFFSPFDYRNPIDIEPSILTVDTPGGTISQELTVYRMGQEYGTIRVELMLEKGRFVMQHISGQQLRHRHGGWQLTREWKTVIAEGDVLVTEVIQERFTYADNM